MKKFEEFVEKNVNKIFIVIFILFTIILLYKIGVVPKGLHVDEAGMAFDAISLITNGTDRYSNQLPVYLINFGGGQSALYAAITSIFVGIFGFGTGIIRLPSVIITLVSLIAMYKLIKNKVGKKEALLISFIYAIVPFNIMKTRWALDAYLFAPMLIIAIYCFINAIDKCEYKYFVISGIVFGLTLYTYIISYIIIPIILAILLVYYLLIKEIDFKQILVLGIPIFLLALPLILMVGYNSGIIPKIKLPLVTIPELWFFRGSEISFSNISINLEIIFEVIFIKDKLGYNAIPAFGTLYYISIPFFIFGLVFAICDFINSIKRKENNIDFVFLIMLVVIFIVSLCIEDININKINALYIPLIYFVAKGIWFLCNKFPKTYIIVIFIYVLELILFLNTYFGEFANTKLYLFEKNILHAIEFAESLNSENVYVENSLNQTYIYTVLGSETNTKEFSKTYKRSGYSIVAFDKYQFYLEEAHNLYDENWVYVIKNDINLINILEEYGFTKETFEEWNVLYYK